MSHIASVDDTNGLSAVAAFGSGSVQVVADGFKEDALTSTTCIAIWMEKANDLIGRS